MLGESSHALAATLTGHGPGADQESAGLAAREGETAQGSRGENCGEARLFPVWTLKTRTRGHTRGTVIGAYKKKIHLVYVIFLLIYQNC